MKEHAGEQNPACSYVNKSAKGLMIFMQDKPLFHKYPDIVTHSDLCVMLSISKNSAYRLLKSGQIKHIKMGRKYLIPKGSVLKYVIDKLS